MGALCAHVRSSVFNVGETVGNCVASCHLPTHQTMTGHLLQKDGHCDPLKRRYALKKQQHFDRFHVILLARKICKCACPLAAAVSF